MKVAIIGMGFVGLSLAVVLSSKNIHTIGVESDKSKLDLLSKGKAPFYEPDLEQMLLKSIKNGKLEFSQSLNEIFELVDIIFVTVGTPTVGGKINLDAIKKVISSIAKLLASSKHLPLVVIKSTIAPNTTNKVIVPQLEKLSGRKLGKDLLLVTNPEFLREGRAIQDQLNPHVIMIGSLDKRSKEIMTNFYDKIYPSSIGRVNVNFATSEMVKYANNAFLATKISFINTISNLCQKIPNTDVDEVARCIGMDARIGPEFLKAGPGYGGSCLPKDLNSFISVYRKYGLNPILFESVKKTNARQIDGVIDILRNKIRNLKGKSISILGLSFKENSDDIRESTSISLIHRLLDEECKIKVYDPLSIPNTRKIFKNKISYFNDLNDCLAKSDCAIIMTPWEQFKNIDPDAIKMMNRNLIIDTRRILNHSGMNLDYTALGVS